MSDLQLMILQTYRNPHTVYYGWRIAGGNDLCPSDMWSRHVYYLHGRGLLNILPSGYYQTVEEDHEDEEDVPNEL